MLNPRVLVVYYSRSGNTRQIARAIAASLGADLDEIFDEENRSGIWGYLRSGRQAFWRSLVRLKAPVIEPVHYDLVVIGTPVWNVSVSSPVRTYLRQHRREIRAIAFFCTYGSMGAERVFGQMSEESGLFPIATLAVLDSKLDSEDTKRRIADFAERVRLAPAKNQWPQSA